LSRYLSLRGKWVRAVQPIYLFDLAFQRSQWLSIRQTAVAENIANANTPNYRTKDVEPFAATLDKTELAMAATNPRHLSLASSPVRSAAVEKPRSWDVVSHGNDVSLEKELIKGGEVSRDYSLNANLVKSFHRMWMASVKG
jgi:flagellar basal-body rod protein FlgB